jgi:hypothetical protein
MCKAYLLKQLPVLVHETDETNLVLRGVGLGVIEVGPGVGFAGRHDGGSGVLWEGLDLWVSREGRERERSARAARRRRRGMKRT